MEVKINVVNKKNNIKEESIPEIKSMLDASHMKGHEPDSLRDILNDTVSCDEFIKERDGKYKDIFDYAYDECGKHTECYSRCIFGVVGIIFAHITVSIIQKKKVP